MSRTNRKSKTIDCFWSRRCFGLCYGKIAKWITKRKERKIKKKLERQALFDPDNVRGRFPGE